MIKSSLKRNSEKFVQRLTGSSQPQQQTIDIEDEDSKLKLMMNTTSDDSEYYSVNK